MFISEYVQYKQQCQLMQRTLALIAISRAMPQVGG
jgi:hypothetical protein